MNCNYKIKIVYDFPDNVDFVNLDRPVSTCIKCFEKYCDYCYKQVEKGTILCNRFYFKKTESFHHPLCGNCYNHNIEKTRLNHLKLLFRGKWILPEDYSLRSMIKDIMNQFEYVKKVNIVERMITKSQKKSLFFEALCNKELNLKEFREFVKKLKRAGFSSNSSVSFINTKPNKYIHQISFQTGKLIHMCNFGRKFKSTYRSLIVYDNKTETETKFDNKTKSYSCSGCDKQFSTSTGRDMHFKVKHKTSCEGCGGTEIEEGGLCKYCIDDAIVYK